MITMLPKLSNNGTDETRIQLNLKTVLRMNIVTTPMTNYFHLLVFFLE